MKAVRRVVPTYDLKSHASIFLDGDATPETNGGVPRLSQRLQRPAPPHHCHPAPLPFKKPGHSHAKNTPLRNFLSRQVLRLAAERNGGLPLQPQRLPRGHRGAVLPQRPPPGHDAPPGALLPDVAEPLAPRPPRAEARWPQPLAQAFPERPGLVGRQILTWPEWIWLWGCAWSKNLAFF